MNDIVLPGCTPTPLASYLKALGLLRLFSRPDALSRGAWCKDRFVLRTHATREEITGYLLHEYEPTPILAPWNGGSGFYEKDKKIGIEKIAAGQAQRLSGYRAAIDCAEAALAGVDRSASPKDKVKQILLVRLRNTLPEQVLDWFDAAVVLTGGGAKYPPLLGTGGNDGRLDFTNNFMQRLVDVMDPETGTPMVRSALWLDMALFGDPAPSLVRNAIGQFSPGQVGGPNSTIGYEDKGRINPWDFVLMIEGALGFAAAAVRRNADETEGGLSYPFTVHATAAGAGNLGPADSGGARGELWMPLWSAFASFTEIRALLSEGRVAIGRRPVRDALDFVRAVHRLGAYRGVDHFQRYGLLMRSGKAYLATPLQRVTVQPTPESKWLDELEHGEWLGRFRRFAQGDKVARRFVMLRKRLEDALFDFANAANPIRVQALLALLSQIQFILARSDKAREAVGPVPLLSARWMRGSDDGTPAYRIARALASLHGEKGRALPLRAQIFPVHPYRHDWIEVACKAKDLAGDRACNLQLTVPWRNRLLDVLIDLLERRLWVAGRLEFDDKPSNARAGVGLEDLNAFLFDPTMDGAVSTLLPGLALVRETPELDEEVGSALAPAAFGLLKLTLTPDKQLRSLASLPGESRIPFPSGMVARLASGNPDQARSAVQAAWRRLHSSGIVPVMPFEQCPHLTGIDPRRAAASLLIPLKYGATAALVRSLIHRQEVTESV